MECKKKAFQSKIEAMSRMDEIKSGLGDPDKKGDLKRAYKCEKCKLWHLTSLSHKQQLVIKNRNEDFPNARFKQIAQFFAKKGGWTLEL